MAEHKHISGVRMKLSSPERVRELSCGEVKKPETINYRTLRPEKDGLFCERIFGPTRSFECACGKYKRSGPKFRGVVCERCGVEVTDNRVRRERMGHIELAAPVVHIWYLRGIPSRLSLLLGTSTKDLEKVVYFAPARKTNMEMYKVVDEGRRTDLVRRGTLVTSLEERIHRHYDSKFSAEEAYRIVHVEDIPVEAGDVINADRVRRVSDDFGEGLFQVEPAYRMVRGESKDDGGEIFPESRLGRMKELMPNAEFVMVSLQNQPAFIVTSAVHLPFKKGDVITKEERDRYNKKYPGRFTVERETQSVEDPCSIVIESGNSMFKRGEIILERQEELCAAYDKNFKGGIGAEGVYSLLQKVDLDDLVSTLREEIAESSGQKKKKLIKRLKIAEDFRKSSSHPEWMVLSVLPVIPPDLRPMVQLDGGRFATSDLNDLYRRVINRNNRLKKLQELRAPDIIIRNEKRMLQESVDALIDNGRRGKAVLGAGNRPLKSLTDLLRGKKGRFRQNLLGKRVDYSGRSVIVIGPNLKIYQCGLPKQMALELFKPFVMNKLVEDGKAPNVKSARRFIERGHDAVWAILEGIIKDHPVMLNRAPTLHRLGIQAFEPVLIEGKAIRLHPLVCTAFNADFDGDQMAVHVPLSIEAQTEARILMLSSNNLLSPASGKSVVTPTQDMLLGIYYLTSMKEERPEPKEQPYLEYPCFRDPEDVESAIDHGRVHINARIKIKVDPAWNLSKDDLDENGYLETSPGRVIFNESLPRELRFINRSITKKDLSSLLDDTYDRIGQHAMVAMLDSIKILGYKWSTLSGISLGIDDITVPAEKKEIVDNSMEKENTLSEQHNLGLLDDEEYMREKDNIWSDAGREIADSIMKDMVKFNPLRMMVDSGARGTRGQVAQMAGIRGLMADPSGKIIAYPIVANFRDGLNMLEYFISTHGARKGLADTALRTAKSGYLTRRLVDVAQDLIITEEDCGTDQGIEVRPLTAEEKVIISLSERIMGRILLRDVLHPETGEVLASAGDEISSKMAAEIENLGIKSVWVRSPLTCGLRHGICRTCYGRDLATRKKIAAGEAVGVVAAQSIGEPGTQLTMRTFHTGGVRQFTGEDITQGLPRIEQLFEIRRPKKVAILAERDGVIVEIRETEGKKKIIVEVENSDGTEERVTWNIQAGQSLKTDIQVGTEIKKGQELTEGYKNPSDLLKIEGLEEVQHYLLDGIQEVYRTQGVSINDKHIETILRKVAPVNRVRVEEEGDSAFVADELVWKEDFDQEVAGIKRDNELSAKEAVEFLRGRVLVDVVGNGVGDLAGKYRGNVCTESIILDLLTPGRPVTELIVHDGDEHLKVIVGEAAFRHYLESFLLMEDFTEGEDTLIESGKVLTAADLVTITRQKPRPVRVCDTETVDSMEESRYLAEDIIVGGEVIAKRDSMLNGDTLDVLRRGLVKSVKLWKTSESLNIQDQMKDILIDYLGKSLGQAIDRDGNAIAQIPPVVDASILNKFAEGSIEAIDVEGSILTHEKMIQQVLKNHVFGRILLSDLKDAEDNIVVAAGSEINQETAAHIAGTRPDSIKLRAHSAPTEVRQVVQVVSFIRRLRETPECRPVVHGVTKAALATDSFLSAASFQQTAQILSAAAVRGEVDELKGLKENVIIGLLIPAGTGVERFAKLQISEKPEEETHSRESA
ncbi:MAG: DNA-directed RNA polymerase subunit beta' [Synergistaceae bacterium]|jgi:DNA-directed RNA polymerase subunit beta'|nr:DNA-directed RNA polymerase subunit beta' [Synergistaceae bacterium]